MLLAELDSFSCNLLPSLLIGFSVFVPRFQLGILSPFHVGVCVIGGHLINTRPTRGQQTRPGETK